MSDLKNIFLTALVILCACSGPEPPADLIGRDKMVQILVEIHLLESRLSNIPVKPKDSTQAVYEHFEKMIFEDMGVTQEQYEISFNYYVDHSNEFEKIYNAVVDSLRVREEKYK